MIDLTKPIWRKANKETMKVLDTFRYSNEQWAILAGTFGGPAAYSPAELDTHFENIPDPDPEPEMYVNVYKDKYQAEFSPIYSEPEIAKHFGSRRPCFLPYLGTYKLVRVE